MELKNQFLKQPRKIKYEINTHDADILLSAANKSHYPQDETQVALAGRSNVLQVFFYSSLLNQKEPSQNIW